MTGGKAAPEKPRILHVSADFPDAVDAAKTPVIERLLSLTEGRLDHRVISLNRVSPPKARWLYPRSRVEELSRENGVTALRYWAPPHGLHHRRMLLRLGEWLAERIDREERRPDLLIGHKLCVEGFAVAHAADLLGLPYALSIQGNTDERILKARPDLRPALRKIYHGAAHVFPFAPWAQRSVERYLGERAIPDTTILPCAMAADRLIAPQPGNGALVTAFHLRNAGLKNLAAIGEASRQSGIPLTVIGGGNSSQEKKARELAGEGPEFTGAIDNARIAETFNAFSGFVLPSKRESFGLVFVEALFAGLPIIYPAGAAVDGYFDEDPFAIRVSARDPGDLARAMRKLVEDETALKSELAQWQAGEGTRRFAQPAIADAFCDGIRQALASAKTSV